MIIGTRTSQTPFYHCVPKDPLENWQWRMRWQKAAHKDEAVRRWFKQAAFEDVLFFVNALCWVYEPRPDIWAKELAGVRPFVTWAHQDPAVLTLDENLGLGDMVIDKSRGEGATWIYLMVILRRWLRDPLFSAGVVSRSEPAVDSHDNPGALMPKLDWALKMLPWWMLPKGWDAAKHRSYTYHTFLNPEIRSTIVGAACTSDLARGERCTAYFLDEFALFPSGTDYKAWESVQAVTHCRVAVSTYFGDSGQYYDLAHNDDSDIVKIVLDWHDNPIRNRQLYRFENGRINVYAPGRPFTADETEKTLKTLEKLRRRGFRIEGRQRSPWYDRECLRSGIPRSIAQELDRDPHGGTAKIFNPEILDAAKEKFAQPPVIRGQLLFDDETYRPRGFSLTETGELSLWFRLGLGGKPPSGSYLIGSDIAAWGLSGGEGASNSVACVIDRGTGEQVAEMATNRMTALEFADVVVAMGKWFHNGLLIWEANGPGVAFGNQVKKHGYPNVWMRPKGHEGPSQFRKTINTGWYCNRDEVKYQLFLQLQLAIADQEFTPRSARLIEECRGYEFTAGKIIFRPSERTTDQASKGKVHGDRVIAAAVAVLAMQQDPFVKVEADEERADESDDDYLARRLARGDRYLRRDPWTGDILDISGADVSTIGGVGIRDQW